MKKLKIYLDTSVINFLFADDTPDFKKITEDFFRDYFGRYDIYISDIVLLEINKTENQEQKSRLLSVIDDYPFKILDISDNDDIGYLSELYINEKEGYLKKLNLLSPLEVEYEDE